MGSLQSSADACPWPHLSRMDLCFASGLLQACCRQQLAAAAFETSSMLAQGQELEALRAALPYQRVIYCGDGANDLCPALALSSSDVVLARQVRDTVQVSGATSVA